MGWPLYGRGSKDRVLVRKNTEKLSFSPSATAGEALASTPYTVVISYTKQCLAYGVAPVIARD